MLFSLFTFQTQEIIYRMAWNTKIFAFLWASSHNDWKKISNFEKILEKLFEIGVSTVTVIYDDIDTST